MKRLLFLLCFVGFSVSFVQARTIKLPGEGEKILKEQFRSWQLAEIETSIVEYNQRKRGFEKPNLIKGDWNGDNKTDYAVLLESKKDARKKITVVLMKSKTGYKSYVLDAADCIMSVKKGGKYYDFETKKSSRYKTDAIFSYYWEKGGSSYIFEKGKFRSIVTSD